MTRLLVVACSKSKRPDARSMPAIDRYDGPAFRQLRRAARVRAYRGLDCPDCVGLAVTVDRTQLGQRIDIRHAGEWVGPFLVVDVGTGTHRAGLVGEIGNRTAVAWRIPGPWRTCYKEAL